ncbi:hypothetical protein BD413DRAFT_602750 [Trametes elegans]|nr:hypothetical protein BD413DRAFT_602750 [Trametes elegans]
MLSDRDEELIRAWADQADGLVTFAALFSAVVTAFIIESYKLLQPDTDLLTLSVLRDISAQLNGSQPFHPIPPFEPLLSDAVQNSFLFASLISSLFSAGTGVFFKEWVREYKLNLPTDPHELVRVRQHRYQGAITWRLRTILGAISLFLQLGVAFFIGGLLLFVWNLDQTLRAVLVVFAAFWMAFWIGSACCPTFSDSCPFISPLSRLIFVVLTAVRRLWLSAGRSPDYDGDEGKRMCG